MTRDNLVILLILTAPIPLILIFALVRGYDVVITFVKKRRE